MSATRIDRYSVASLVIQHKVRRHAVAGYEAWSRRALGAAGRWPGCLGGRLIRPSGAEGVFITVVRFAAAAQLRDWLVSAERAALLREVGPLLEGGDHPLVQGTGEFRCQGARRRPAKWKQALLSCLGLLPLELLANRFWAPLFERYPALAGTLPAGLLLSLSVVLPLVYLVMPWASGACARWLADEVPPQR